MLVGRHVFCKSAFFLVFEFEVGEGKVRGRGMERDGGGKVVWINALLS
jgi:hypothetical protein